MVTHFSEVWFFGNVQTKMVSFCCNVLSRLLNAIKKHKSSELDHWCLFFFIATYLATENSRLFQYDWEFFDVVFIREK
jgi:hypothetical protein